MYCESLVGHVAHEHIEHHRPKCKAKYPQLTYEWSNLGLACPMCNGNKSDDFDENCPHINPYEENPDLFFVAAGPMIFPKQSNARAELTSESVKLNRPGLLEHRAERMKNVQLLVQAYEREPSLVKKSIWKRRIIEEISGEKEYSFCLREFVARQLGSDFVQVPNG